MYSSLVQSACNCRSCRGLIYGSFQLTHVTWWHAVQLIEPWRPNEDRTLLQRSQRCSQGWVSIPKHQHTTAITTMWTESSWAFPESYTTGSCARAIVDNGETKGLITPPPRWVSAQLFYEVAIGPAGSRAMVRARCGVRMRMLVVYYILSTYFLLDQ